MKNQELQSLFEQIVRRHLPRVALGTAMVGVAVGATACDSGDDDYRWRREPSEVTDVMVNHQPFDDARMAQLREELRQQVGQGATIPLELCQRWCEPEGGALHGCELYDHRGEGPEGQEGEQGLLCSFTVRYMRPVGRRAPGVAEAAPSRADDPVGRWFADCASMEEEAVYAFAGLLDELVHHGAPMALREACLEALIDEVHHTHLTRALASGLGAASSRPQRPGLPRRTLLEMALDNAVEGCVKETCAALQATWQAQTAQPGPVREALARIAHDETGHAAFSWRLDAWLMTQLDEGERAQVLHARRGAMVALRRQLEGLDGPTPEALGFPAREASLALFDDFFGPHLATA